MDDEKTLTIKEHARAYRIKNKAKRKEYNHQYHQQHPEKRRARDSRYHYRHKNELWYITNKWLSQSIRYAILNNVKGMAWEKTLGYTLEQLKEHLQKKRKKGMSWRKYRQKEVQIDHIVPKSRLKYTSFEDPTFKECWGLHNLQLLWKPENEEKRNINYQEPLLFQNAP